jgi:hypothetical protein
MRFLFLVLVMLAASAPASAQTLSIAWRGLAGASVRLEHPVADRLVFFEDVGATGWVVPGGDPETGEASPLLLRLHGKLGVDVALGEMERSHGYVGARGVGAYIFNTVVGPQADAGLSVIGGVKWNAGSRLRLQLGGGVGGFYLWTIDDPSNRIIVPLPVLEARFGYRF